MFELPPLPFAEDALAPLMSRDTLTTHHDKHHAAYIKKTNSLLQEKGWNDVSLEEVVRRAQAEKEQKLFNNAAQAWNHAFFWQSLSPQAQVPSGDLATAVDAKFGGRDQLRAQFLDQGENHFGSGWLWLCVGADEDLALIDLHDAQTPVVDAGVTPILACDLWEHAYYLDVKNERRKYLEGVFDKLLNWSFGETQFRAARAGGQGAWRFANGTQQTVSQRASNAG